MECNDYTCPYWEDGYCYLENPAEECDEYYGMEEE